MGILTYKGATAEGERNERRGAPRVERHSSDDEQVVSGADLFASLGCLNCHTYGTGRPGQVDLSEYYYTQERGVDYWVDWIRDPQAIKPGTTMPAFPT